MLTVSIHGSVIAFNIYDLLAGALEREHSRLVVVSSWCSVIFRTLRSSTWNTIHSLSEVYEITDVDRRYNFPFE